MGRKATQEETEYKVTIRVQNGNIVPEEELKNRVIENELCYEKIKVIKKRIKEQYGFEKVYYFNFWLNFHFTNFIKRLTNECLDVIILM